MGAGMRSFAAATRALLVRVVIAVVLCAAVTATGVVLVNRYIDRQVANIPRVRLTTASVGDSGTNFLIIGSDSRAFVDTDAEFDAFSDENTQNAPARSDTMMVLHAAGDRSYLVSFPRDLWVDIPGRGASKLNAAFNDGPQKVIDTLAANFDLPIHHYLEVDFVTFEAIVNAVGAVPVYIPGVVLDRYTGLYAPFGAGCYWLDGPAALQYVRAREIRILDPQGDYYDAETGQRWKLLDATADIGRIERQQDFVRKLGRIAVARALDDPFLAPDLVDAVLPNLQADSGFDRTSFNALVRAFLGLAAGRAGLQFATLPWDGPTTRERQSVVVPKYPEVETVLGRLRGEIPVEPEPVATSVGAPRGPSPAGVRVRVLNGSGVDGAAGRADQQLGNRGFVSGGTGNFEGGPVARTLIRYRPGDEAKAQLLAGFVPGAELVADASMQGGDVVLVIGADFEGIGATVKGTAVTLSAERTPTPEAACN